MGWLDGSTAAFFKQDAEGRDLFFPWGKLGKGRVISSTADRAWVKRYLKIYYVCVIVIDGTLLVLGKIMRNSLEPTTVAMFAVVFLAVILVPLMPVWLRARAWPVATERALTAREAMMASAKEVGPVFLWIGIVGSGLMTAASLFLLVVGDELLDGIVLVVFCGGAFGYLVWLFRARRRG